MEKEMLKVLSDLLDNKLEPVVNKLNSIEKKLDAVYGQTADLTEFRTDVNTKLDSIQDDLNAIELVTSKNWNDIAKLKSVK